MTTKTTQMTHMTSDAICKAATVSNVSRRMATAVSATQQQRPPPKKNPIEPEVLEFFKSIEMANLRLYESLLKVDINNGHGKQDVMHLSEIRKNLSTKFVHPEATRPKPKLKQRRKKKKKGYNPVQICTKIKKEEIEFTSRSRCRSKCSVKDDHRW